MRRGVFFIMLPAQLRGVTVFFLQSACCIARGAFSLQTFVSGDVARHFLRFARHFSIMPLAFRCSL